MRRNMQTKQFKCRACGTMYETEAKAVRCARKEKGLELLLKSKKGLVVYRPNDLGVDVWKNVYFIANVAVKTDDDGACSCEVEIKSFSPKGVKLTRRSRRDCIVFERTFADRQRMLEYLNNTLGQGLSFYNQGCGEQLLDDKNDEFCFFEDCEEAMRMISDDMILWIKFVKAQLAGSRL